MDWLLRQLSEPGGKYQWVHGPTQKVESDVYCGARWGIGAHQPNMCWQISAINLNGSTFFQLLTLWTSQIEQIQRLAKPEMYFPSKHITLSPLAAKLSSRGHPGHVQQAGDRVQRLHRLLWRLSKVPRGGDQLNLRPLVRRTSWMFFLVCCMMRTSWMCSEI